MPLRYRIPLIIVVAALALAWLWLVATVLAAPALTGRVNDYAGLLTSTQRGDIVRHIKRVEAMPRHPQIVVLLPKTLDGDDVAHYAGEVFRAWKLGQHDENNGILIVVAPTERKLRIEVGYGLEGAVPDLYALQVMNAMKVHLGRGKENWAAAIETAITQLETRMGSER
jgi:uncharacterized protein